MRAFQILVFLLIGFMLGVVWHHVLLGTSKDEAQSGAPVHSGGSAKEPTEFQARSAVQLGKSMRCPAALLADGFGGNMQDWPGPASKPDGTPDCYGLVRGLNYDFVKDPSIWARGGRPLPPIHPPLASGDWQGTASKPSAWPQFNTPLCKDHQRMTAVKIYKGKLYTFDYGRFYWENRRRQMEMILTAMWLYKDLPDMEFLITSQARTALYCPYKCALNGNCQTACLKRSSSLHYERLGLPIALL
jgi:hypothetical protein